MRVCVHTHASMREQVLRKTEEDNGSLELEL